MQLLGRVYLSCTINHPTCSTQTLIPSDCIDIGLSRAQEAGKKKN